MGKMERNQEKTLEDLRVEMDVAKAEFEIVRRQKRYWDNEYIKHDRKQLDAISAYADKLSES